VTERAPASALAFCIIGHPTRSELMSQDIALLTHSLTKSYGSVRALRGLDLEVRRGEIFGFLGPNGAGKTTTIRCLLDLIRPDGGALRVLGIDPQANPVEVRARTGYLPGELRVEDNFTVEQVLRYFNDLRDGKADWSFVRHITQRIDLDLAPRVKNLSKGNKQKVGVVLALMHRPELLLLDEPTIGLDPLIQHEVLRLIVEARDAGATVFFSSHNLSEVQEIAERVGIIRQGVVVEVAETAALINRSMRRASIRFEQPVDSQALAALPGVKLLRRDDGRSVLLQVEGKMDGLIKALAAFPVIDFETERPSLEEIFLTYYEDDRMEVK
jgi:ABC-2 type transport system ATP-binding protein